MVEEPTFKCSADYLPSALLQNGGHEQGNENKLQRADDNSPHVPCRAQRTMEERRGKQRFLFQQPVVLRSRDENVWREIHATVENAGEMGVLVLRSLRCRRG